MNEHDPIGIRNIIQRALNEDIGDGDVTTTCTASEDTVLDGRFVAKHEGILAGIQVARETFHFLDPHLVFTPLVADGIRITHGTTIARIRANGRAILSAERVALNILQRMSGIATTTRAFVEAVRGTKATIVDTRKTAPGLRVLDKMAVRIGGGSNHRFGLFDRVLIKENHIVAAGGIKNAVSLVRSLDKRKRSIEVEVRTLEELDEALELSVDQILLDNMNLRDMAEAVKRDGGRVPLEASGNVTLETVASIAATGVDSISVGMLTHSVRALDISFLIDP